MEGIWIALRHTGVRSKERSQDKGINVCLEV